MRRVLITPAPISSGRVLVTPPPMECPEGSRTCRCTDEAHRRALAAYRDAQ